MSSLRVSRARLGTLRGSPTASAARDVLMEALDRALLEPVRFRTADGEFVVGGPTGSDECAYVLDVLSADFFTDVV